jgi:hypothetical protein
VVGEVLRPRHIGVGIGEDLPDNSGGPLDKLTSVTDYTIFREVQILPGEDRSCEIGINKLVHYSASMFLLFERRRQLRSLPKDSDPGGGFSTNIRREPFTGS